MDKSYPYYIADISSGYIQNKQQKYFRGKTGVIKVKPGLNAVGVLSNPINSGTKIYINKLLIIEILKFPRK